MNLVSELYSIAFGALVGLVVAYLVVWLRRGTL